MSGAGAYGISGQTVNTVLSIGTSFVHAGRIDASVLVSINQTPQARTGYMVIEVLATQNIPIVRRSCSGIVVEALIPSAPRVLKPVYPPPPGTDVGPDLSSGPQVTGLTYNVFKREVFNAGVYQAASGREVRVKFWDGVIWEWDLTYSYLPNDRTGRHPGATESDFHAMVAFFLETRGGQMPFTFYDPDDNYIKGQFIGTTDGINNVWMILRSLGTTLNEIEPIGYLNFSIKGGYTPPLPPPPGYPVLYLDGVPQNITTIDYITNELGKQLVRFKQVPAAGQTITMDFHYMFFARFADLMYEFEEFVSKIWSAQKITLQSMKSYTKW
jgi:hypothetical protein